MENLLVQFEKNQLKYYKTTAQKEEKQDKG